MFCSSSKYLFSTESTFRGHPDKVCDQIADAILDEFIANDPNSRAAIEVMIYPYKVIVAGETSAAFHLSNTQIDFIVRDTLMKIGYINQRSFAWDNINVSINLSRQSDEIAQAAAFESQNERACDQGIMFGYAVNHNDVYMPDPIYYAHKLVHVIEDFIVKHSIQGLGPDGKCQITFEFENGVATKIKLIVISIMHDDTFDAKSIKEVLKEPISTAFEPKFDIDNNSIVVNPSGSFKIGGPESDVGLTGRKLMVDTYGGYVLHGGGAFCGKDPSKLDRSGAYALRHLAKNIVASGISKECLIQVAYAIGMSDPVSLLFETGDDKLNQHLEKMVPELYDFSPNGIRNSMSLNRPIYHPTSFYGHFGRKYQNDGFFTWEQLNLVDSLGVI